MLRAMRRKSISWLLHLLRIDKNKGSDNFKGQVDFNANSNLLLYFYAFIFCKKNLKLMLLIDVLLKFNSRDFCVNENNSLSESKKILK